MPTQTTTLSVEAVEAWWDALQVYQRANWLHRQNFKNITTAQWDWTYLTASEQTDIWILRARELSK